MIERTPNLPRIGAVLGLLITGSAAQAQAPAQLGTQRRKVTLREALQLAARQGPDVAVARAQAAVTAAGRRRAWTYWQPDVSATGSFDHTNGFSSIPAGALGPNSPAVTIVGQNSTYATFQVSQPLLTPQGLFLPGIANLATEAANLSADEQREQVLLNTARTYLGLQGIEGLIQAARDAEKVALRREQDARAQIAAGTAVEITLLRAQTETAQARVQIANLEGQKQSDLPLLEALTGEPIEPQQGKPEDLGPAGQESQQPWEQAFSVRSAVVSARATQRSVTYDHFLWMPSLSAIAKQNYTSNGGFAEKNWTYDLILSVSVPIYDKGNRYATLSEDRAKLAQAQAQLASTRARARSTWIGARANLASSQVALEQADIQVQFATRTQQQVDASYRAGVATSLDLSDADQRKFSAQSTAAQAKANLEIRKAELAAAEGRLYNDVAR